MYIGGDFVKKRVKIFIAFIIFLLIILSGFFAFVELRIKNLRADISELEAGDAAASALSKGLDETLAEYKINYDDVVDFSYDSAGNIKSLSVDIITLNTLGNELGKKIDENISEYQSYKTEIPLTALIGEEMTSGLGPKIPFYISMKGSSTTKFSNNFESTGVNQTRHQIMLDISVNMYVVFGGKVDIVEYKSNVCIAESIIVGVTPSTFANF